MNIGNYTKTLRDDLRKCLLITLTLLVFPIGAWGQETWTEVSTAEALRGIFNNGGNAKLTANIGDHGLTVTCTTTPVKLDLNGCTIDGNNQGTVIIISSGATLTILDSSTEKDGKITGGANSTTAGTGNPGNINCGGGVRNNGTFYFQSGKITGNSAGDGAGVFNNGTMVMSGGEISGNTCNYSGYGIFNNWGASLTITGGSVINNTGGYNLSSVVGGGILNRGASLTLSGNPVIKNNTGSGNPSNIYLLNNCSTITIGDGGLTGNNGDIGIMMQTPGVFTSGLNSATGYQIFTSDLGDYEPCFGGTDNKEATLLRNWLSLKNRMEAGGTIVLNKDYTATTSDACLTVPSEKSVTLDLNSYTIHRNLTSATTDGCVIKNQGTLTLNGSGVIRGGNNTGDGGGINNTGALTIDGNIRICLNSCNGNGDGIYNNGSLTLAKNPEVINNRSTDYNRQNIYLASGKIINISGTLTGSAGRIGVTMQTPGVFTTGLSSNEASFFVSDNSGLKLYKNTTLNESVIGTYWSHLQYQIDTAQDNPAEATVITLETNKAYEALSTESYLHIPASKKISIVKNGVNYINRNSSTAREEGYVIKNEGELSINGCYISGGYNHGDGGGIYNTGKLELKGHAWIWKCRATGNGGAIYNSTTGEVTLNNCSLGRENFNNEAEKGGGIYNDGTLKHENYVIFQYNRASINGGAIYQNGTLEIKGETQFSYNYNSTIYLPTNKVIKVTGDLTNNTNYPIRVSMETLGVFTDGLNTYGDVTKFQADAGSSVIEISLNGDGEAVMETYWSKLQQQITDAGTNPTTINLNQTYYGYISDTPLTIGNGQNITIVMTNHTINRDLSDNFKENGNVFHVKSGGKLTIQGYGRIMGGRNTGNGGGILNEGSLTLNGNDAANGAIDIGSNKVVSGKSGAGIYLANTGSLTIQGYVYVSGNYIGSEYTTRNDIYIPSGQTITTSSINVNSKIGITHADSHAVFTSGLSWSSLVNIPFYADDSEHYKVGRTSNGEAVIGPYYNITNPSVDHGSVSVNTKAVEGEVVSITPASNEGYVPMSLSYTPTEGSGETVITTYPENATHTFTMPAQNITINAKFKPGGFCGDTGNESKVKYYLPAENGTLTFVAKDDGNDHAMASTYASADDVPWKNMSYSSVSLSDHVSSISPYAFFGSSISSITIPGSVTAIGTLALGNCQNLSTINVTGSTSFSVDGNVLYNNGKTRLLCFPAGLNATSYTLPSTVETIDDGAFAYNPRLNTINVGGGSHFKAENGVLFNYAGTALYCYPARKEGDVYDVASTVTEIKPYAFHNNNQLKVVNFCEASVPTGGTAMFDGTTFKIMVKKDKASSYKESTNWIPYKDIIFEMNLANAAASLKYTTHKCTEASLYPDLNSSGVTITVDGQTITLRKDIDYTIEKNSDYYTNNTAVGTATVTIKGAGGYAGTNKALTFTITRELIISGADNRYTYYASEDLTLPSHLTAWTYTAINWETGVMTATQIHYIPANVPVILHRSGASINETLYLTAHAGGTHANPIQYYRGTATAKDIDVLKTEINTELHETTEYIYVLRGENFVRATSGTLPAKHCYLYKPSGTAAPSVLTTTFSTISGGSYKIETLNASNGTVNIQYDNSGTPTNVTVNTTEIPAGKTVTLTITPDDGYYLSALQCEEVTTLDVAMAPARRADRTQEIHKININSNYEGHFAGDYTFPMPRNNVIVTATFVACTSINSFDLTLDGDNVTKTYDRSPHTVTLKNSDTPLEKGTEYGITTGSETYTNVSSNLVTLTGWGRYNGTKSATLSITAKTLNVTADAKSKTYADPDPTLTYTTTGLESGDENVITGALSRNSGENVGTYSINQNTLSAGSNYSISYTSANLTINQRDISNTAVITLNSVFMNYDGSTPFTPGISSITDPSSNDPLVLNTDYNAPTYPTPGVYSQTDHIQPDIYTISVSFKGNYTGTKTVEYQIRKQLNLTDQAARWMTYYEATYNMEVIDGFEAYTIKEVTASSVTLEQRDFIRANNTPMLLYRSGDAKQFNLPLLKPTDSRVTNSQNATTGWKLSDEYKICTSSMTLPGAIPSGKEIWILVDDHFMRTKSGTLIAGRCYIERSNSSYTSPMLSIGRKTTGIEEETIKDFDLNGVWYTLDGRKIQGIPAQKGIYIKNGKKIIIK